MTVSVAAAVFRSADIVLRLIERGETTKQCLRRHLAAVASTADYLHAVGPSVPVAAARCRHSRPFPAPYTRLTGCVVKSPKIFTDNICSKLGLGARKLPSHILSVVRVKEGVTPPVGAAVALVAHPGTRTGAQ